MARALEPVMPIGDGDILFIRGRRVMLDSRVAEAFGTETRQVNQAVTRNPDKFSEDHCFQLDAAEFERLMSRVVISNEAPKGRGGRRKPARVFTIKGVARLATVLNTPEALTATDLIIDTFLLVQAELAQGRRTIAIPEPERYRTTPEQRDEISKLRKRLSAAVARLLDTMIDAEENRSLRDVTKALGSGVLADIKERLRTKGLENTKLEADTSLVVAQAEKVLAEARKAHAEADGLDIANFERRISAVRKVADLIRELEPPEVVQLMQDFTSGPLRLDSPDNVKE